MLSNSGKFIDRNRDVPAVSFSTLVEAQQAGLSRVSLACLHPQMSVEIILTTILFLIYCKFLCTLCVLIDISLVKVCVAKFHCSKTFSLMMRGSANLDLLISQSFSHGLN